MATLRTAARRASMLFVGAALAGCTGEASCGSAHPVDAAMEAAMDAATDAVTADTAAPLVDRPAPPPDAGAPLDAARPFDAGTPGDTTALDATASDGGTPCDDLLVFTTAGAPGCGQPVPAPRAGPTAGMMLVPGGAFWRGCDPSTDPLCQRDEQPGACLTLRAFEIDATEVTQQAYARCAAAGACTTAHQSTCPFDPVGAPNLPVACVDWSEADAYCRWAGKRLPTEAEWEKAARGTDGRSYPWGNEAPTCDRANLLDCHNARVDVGSTPSGDSPYGLHDMAGNVWEWTADLYAADYYAHAPRCAPTGPATSPMTMRPGRGGGFEHLPTLDMPAVFLRTSFRHAIEASIARVGIGFRCARSVP